MTMGGPEGGEGDFNFEPRIGRSVSLADAAVMLGVSRRTIYYRIRNGWLQTIRTRGGSQRILLESVGRPVRPRGRPSDQRISD
jgi:excisionase family DNA binding protein